jgi:hypothetical protein
MRSLPRQARRILNEGTICYLTAPSRAGPHLTPVVFVLDGGRLWGTTGRNTTKAKLWRSEPVAGGLIGSDGSWLTFRGPVTLYDALDPSTWPDSLRRGPRVASASIRFTMKNARFFAGYARDATRVPFAWTPPGRVIFSIDLTSGALVEKGEIAERWGPWGKSASGSKTYRDVPAGASLDDLPEEIQTLLGRPGDGTVALPSPAGPVVLPARWSASGGVFLAVVPASLRSLVGRPSSKNASLVIDRASAWRAAKMKGVMLRGPADIYLVEELRSGGGELPGELGDASDDAAVIRITPRSAVWWSGWASDTVRPS